MRHAIPALVITALLAVPSIASAGDPCPIGFDFWEVGSPEWLDNAELLAALESKDSWIGISFKSGKAGLPVTNVSDGSPASKAGLVKGDLITALDGQPMTDHKAGGAVFRGKKPGETVKVDIKRGEETKSLTVTLGGQDPFIGAMIDFAAAQNCSDARRANFTADQRAAIMAKLFKKAGRFECKTAHRKLRKLDFLEDGDIVIVRGSKRVLVANTGWATTCVKAADHDGAKLTQKGVGKVFEKVTRAYVKDRIDNP